MFKNYISLSAALADLDRREIIIKNLRAGRISSYSAIWFKANLNKWGYAKTLSEFVSNIFFTAKDRREALEKIVKQSNWPKHIWAPHNYYTLVEGEDGFAVFCDGDYRATQPGIQIAPSFWINAFIDESRWSVLCDDLPNLQRMEFMHVNVDNIAVSRLKTVRAIGKVGAPNKYDPAIAEYAHEIIIEKPSITQEKWYDLVYTRFGKAAGSRNTFLKHYRHLWRKN